MMPPDPSSREPFPEDQSEPVGRWRRFWRRHSPNGEFPWSVVLACMTFSFFIVSLVIAASPFFRIDPTPPGVDVIVVGEDAGAADELNDETLDETAMDVIAQDELLEEMTEQPLTELEKIAEPEPIEPTTEPVESGTELAVETDAARDVLDRLNFAREQLANNIQLSDTPASGAGEVTGSSGRGARVERWILHFNVRSPRKYLRQITGLGAEFAFPTDTGRWRFCTLSASDKPSWIVRDLAGENRLYWIDESDASMAAVAQHLAIPTPPMMVVFMSNQLEQRMLDMELSFQNLEEKNILRTEYEVIERGNQYDVQITKQVPKKGTLDK